MKTKMAVLSLIFMIFAALAAGTTSANGTDHPVCDHRIEISVDAQSFTVPAPPNGWLWVSVWSKSANNPHIQQSHVVGATFTSGEFNQNGKEQNISHVDLCKEKKWVTTTTEATTTSTSTTSQPTTNTLGVTTTSTSSTTQPQNTTSTVLSGSTSVVETSSSVPETSTTSSSPSSTVTPTSTSLPGGSSTTPETPDPPRPLEPSSASVPDLPATGFALWQIIVAALVCVGMGGFLMILVMAPDRDDPDEERWFGN